MSLGLTALELARIQFAPTVSFHIIFPATSIGFSLLSCHAGMRAGCAPKIQFIKDLFKYWIKIFAVAFAMGVVSGIVMAASSAPTGVSFTHRRQCHWTTTHV